MRPLVDGLKSEMVVEHAAAARASTTRRWASTTPCGRRWGEADRAARRERRVAEAVIRDPEEHTVMDKDGAVRSIQAAYVTSRTERARAALDARRNLERLARTYWKYLSRVTLGLIRVTYTEDERAVVLLFRPFVLLRFHAPEYEFSPATAGSCAGGSRTGCSSRRAGAAAAATWRSTSAGCRRERRRATARVHVEVEVANFYPAIATWLTALGLLAHAVAHPRDRHPRLPALARAARARGVGGRALRCPRTAAACGARRTARSPSARRRGAWIAALAAAGVAALVGLVLWLTRD